MPFPHPSAARRPQVPPTRSSSFSFQRSPALLRADALRVAPPTIQEIRNFRHSTPKAEKLSDEQVRQLIMKTKADRQREFERKQALAGKSAAAKVGRGGK